MRALKVTYLLYLSNRLNPITKIKMLQALRRMGALLQALTPGYKPPSQDVLNEICDSANGDIRFAMLSLQTKPQEGLSLFMLYFAITKKLSSFDIKKF